MERYFVIAPGNEHRFFAGTYGAVIQNGEVKRLTRNKIVDPLSLQNILEHTKQGYLIEVPKSEFVLCERFGTL